MPRICRCGGALVTVLDLKYYFQAKCDKCGATHEQRKRMPGRTR